MQKIEKNIEKAIIIINKDLIINLPNKDKVVITGLAAEFEERIASAPRSNALIDQEKNNHTVREAFDYAFAKIKETLINLENPKLDLCNPEKIKLPGSLFQVTGESGLNLLRYWPDSHLGSALRCDPRAALMLDEWCESNEARLSLMAKIAGGDTQLKEVEKIFREAKLENPAHHMELLKKEL